MGESFTHAPVDMRELLYSNSQDLLASLEQIGAKSDEVTLLAYLP